MSRSSHLPGRTDDDSKLHSIAARDSNSRVGRYATLARIAPAAIPAALLAVDANAVVYSQTGLSLQIGPDGNAETMSIEGSAGATVGQLSIASWGNSYVHLTGANFTWQGLEQKSSAEYWWGGVPVSAGATWNNLGRTTGEFAGTSVDIRTTSYADINFGETTAGGFDDDPQRVGNTGDTWYLLFQFKDGDANGNYGWLSFDANVNGGPNPDANSYITITGWGWDDSGSPIEAGHVPEPGTGAFALAALAAGAAGIRRSRRRKPVTEADSSAV